MRRRIFRTLFLISAASLLLAVVLCVLVVYGAFRARLRQELVSEAHYIAAGLAQAPDADALLLAAGGVDSTRVTLIAADGTVLFDSDADPASMENHSDRPEVRDATLRGEGESIRASETLQEETLYYALRLSDGTVLRVSDSHRSLWGMLLSILPGLAGVVALCLALCLLLARSTTKAIIAPLNALDLNNPLNNDVYDELAPLLSRLEAQKRQLGQQMRELLSRRDEFSAIADNMREGLLVLNAYGAILTINNSAQRLFHTQADACLGKHVLTLGRSLSLREAVDRAAEGERAEQVLQLYGREYQLIASPVREQEKITGVVVLILDVTEREARERLRREFSANVSHELKTPLTSICGYAEIMKDGVARPEDMPDFARRIHEESTRLLALIEDIIRLSRLDEGSGNLPFEPVDLYALAQDVAGRLAAAARAQDVAVSVSGAPAIVRGVRQVLDEMLYNLCDNAIRYNNPGGSVAVSVAAEGANTVVTVADTGIGIPRAHHERVFERFYRVDRSHSKATGGTGLGLSIVKHGAMLHGAKITLDSAPGRGTTIRLRFPSGA